MADSDHGLFSLIWYAYGIQIGDIMNIEEFANRIKATISDILKKEVRIIKKMKINGVTLYGICISEPDSNIEITVYLESFFETFLDTDNWPQSVNSILEFYHNHESEKPFDMEWFRDFSQVRPKLYYILVNYEANRELLCMVPHTRFLDLAKIYYVQCQIGESNTGSILVYNKHMEYWGISDDELDKAAEENTPRLYPARITNLDDILGLDNLQDAPFELSPEPEIPIFALSNTASSNGAAVICYKDILDRFSQQVKDDLVILPSSVHETMLLPLHKNSDISAHKEMVHDVNRTMLERSEFLSDNVYIFSRENKQLMIA